MTDHEFKYADDFAGLAEYIRGVQAGGYRVHEVVQAKCEACDGRVFDIVQDDYEGVVQRMCVGCGVSAYVADSADHLEDAETMGIVCTCGRDKWEVGVGFSLLPDGEVRWLSVGIRCVADGRVGMCADWKIDYSPSAHLMEKC